MECLQMLFGVLLYDVVYLIFQKKFFVYRLIKKNNGFYFIKIKNKPKNSKIYLQFLRFVILDSEC